MTDRERTLKDIISDITEQELAENCPIEPITREELHRKIKENRKRRLRKPIALAVIAAVIAVGFIALWPMLSPQDINVDADKNGKEEILTDDGVIIEDKGWGSSSEDGLTITDWDDIVIAKIHVEELLIPEYIPEGYEFEELKVEIVEREGTNCNYKFIKDGSALEVREYISYEKLQALEIDTVHEVMECNKGKVYIQKTNKGKIATIYIDDGIIVEVDGSLDDEEIIKLIEELRF